MLPRASFRRTATVALGLTAVLLAVPATAVETDPRVLEAERTLRAAELRDTDEIALALYRQACEQAETALARNPNSAGANFVYFAAKGRILLADGATKNLFALRTLDRKYLDRALELDPRYANALAAKGGVLLDLPTLIGGDPVEGLRLLRRANEINPGGVGGSKERAHVVHAAHVIQQDRHRQAGDAGVGRGCLGGAEGGPFHSV